MMNDNTAASVAKRKKLEQQLEEAREDLAEKEYDHSIDTQLDALDKQLENYENEKNAEIEALQAYVTDIEAILAESFETVKANAATIGEQITSMANQHGIEVSDALISSWYAGENAIASYGSVLDAGSSAFIGNLQNVENQTWELQNQANQTAEGLADMFATRADGLIDELAASYSAESNVGAMTEALHQSLISTLESGYNASSAIQALGSIRDAADAARSAIEALNAAAGQETPQYERNVQPLELKSPFGVNTVSYQVKDYSGNTLRTFSNLSEAEKWRDKTATAAYITSKVNKYAKGLKKAKEDEMAWTQENGQEAILSPSRNAILTPIRSKDTVLTAEQTKNLFEWAKMKPMSSGSSGVTLPQANIASTQSLNVSSLVTINGNVNDSVEMMKVAAKQAQEQIKSSFRKLSDGIHK